MILENKEKNIIFKLFFIMQHQYELASEFFKCIEIVFISNFKTPKETYFFDVPK